MVRPVLIGNINVLFLEVNMQQFLAVHELEARHDVADYCLGTTASLKILHSTFNLM